MAADRIPEGHPSSQTPPASVTGAFPAHERPLIDLVRASGPARLWRSVTPAHEIHGFSIPEKTQFHVTVGEEVDCLFVRDVRSASLQFEIAASSSTGLASSANAAGDEVHHGH